MPVVIRKPYGKRERVTFDTNEEAEGANQSFKDECDINHLLAKYFKTGVINHFNKQSPLFADAVNVDLLEAHNIINDAKEMFSSLPSKVRTRFDNSPEKYLQFLSIPENRTEAAHLGLLQEDSPTAIPSPQTDAEIAAEAKTKAKSADKTEVETEK